ncbi:unnamed protein product [Trichobilharzia szidati]|nr:unnamed protein product [Trichobilharzia szidati]
MQSLDFIHSNDTDLHKCAHNTSADVYLFEDSDMNVQSHDENAPLLGDDSDNFSPDSYSPLVNDVHSDADFNRVVQMSLQAIESGIHPERIYQGSSGSYFVKNIDGVVRLVSDSFNYSPVDRAKSKTKQHVASHFPEIGRHFNRLGLPPKIGSFQLFVSDCEDADYWLRHFDNESLPKPTAKEFQFQFEKLVVLDYLIRNTDRGNDNWLIRYHSPELKEGTDETTKDDWGVVGMPKIELFAIDNGLAFPFKHPDEWRAYPFYWAWLPMAKEPFSDLIKEAVLPLLSDVHFINGLVRDLHNLFKIDPGFDLSTFQKQMSVLRGQVVNLIAALRDSKSPYDLVRMPVLTLELSTKKRYNKPRWPHQRLAAGLAHGTATSTTNDDDSIDYFRSYTHHPTVDVIHPVLSVNTDQQSVSVDTNQMHNLIGYNNCTDLNNIQPTTSITQSNSTVAAGDNNAYAIAVGTEEEEEDGIDALEHGLVALPSFKPKQSISTDKTAEVDLATANSLGDDVQEDDEDAEQRFNLRYYKKPFFSWF